MKKQIIAGLLAATALLSFGCTAAMQNSALLTCTPLKARLRL